MRQVVLYATASLDGFIAELGGGMGWLDAASEADTDFGYPDFYASIETMLMGSATYEFVLGATDEFPRTPTARSSSSPSVTCRFPPRV